MAYIQPQSEVWLCRDVPLDPSYDNQLTFTTGTGASRQWDLTAQRAYFASKAVYHPTNFSIVKERDGVLRMTGDVGNYYDINYMYFTNTNFSNKFFYAFVTQVEYVNPNTTLIYFELDEFQTWANDIVWMESSIEREHTEHDELYANLEDEGIGVNDLQPYAYEYVDSALGEKQLVIGTTESYSGLIEDVQSQGVILSYDYNTDYPGIESMTVDKYITLKDLYIFKDNQVLRHNGFSYNHDSTELKIYGVSDISFNRIFFKVYFRYLHSLGNRYETAVWLVKGEKDNNNNWVWSRAGEYIPYDMFTDFPNFSLLEYVELTSISNIIGYSNHVKVNYFLAGYAYSQVGDLTYPNASNRLWFAKAINQDLIDEVYFTIKGWRTKVGDIENFTYNMHGTYDGTSWSFKEVV